MPARDIGTTGNTATQRGIMPISGGTFTGAIILPDGSSAAPSLRWGSGTGFYRSSASLYWANGSGVKLWRMYDPTGSIIQASTSQIAWTSTDGDGTADIAISRNASGVLEINSSSAGTFRDLAARATALSSGITVFNATAIAAGANTNFVAKFSSTSNFGVYFGSGAPSFVAAQGSLYIRSDGSSTTSRAYITINSTGVASAWTAITTGA